MKRILPLLVFTLVMVGCSSQKDVVYFQDAVFNVEEVISNAKQITVQPEDKLSIVVSCKEPQIAKLLNSVESTININGRLKSGNGDYSESNSRTVGYTVDSKGDIQFPIIGTIHIAGLTREQVAQKIKDLIISHGIVSDPVVSVEYLNLHFSVIGEVARPGKYSISNETTTLLDALSQAGDLTIYGKRDAVYLIREQNGKRVKYLVDLRNKDLFDSPAYYIQQGDIIYVEPNQTRIGQSKINENNWKSVGLWISIASLLMSAAVLIFK